MTHAQDWFILNSHLCNPFKTATATTHGIHNNPISAQTVPNPLCDGGLSAHCSYDGCVLERCHRVNHVNWAHTHQHWLRQQRKSVLFSDESRSTIHQGDGRVQGYPRRNECYANCCVLEQDCFVTM